VNLLDDLDLKIGMLGNSKAAAEDSKQSTRIQGGRGLIPLEDQGVLQLSLSCAWDHSLVDGHSLFILSGSLDGGSNKPTVLEGVKWIRIDGFKLPDRVVSALANGYNCWSNSPMLTKSDVLVAETDKVQEYFGDAWFYNYREEKGRFHAWSYTVVDYGESLGNHFIGGVCEDRFYNVVDLDLINSTYSLLVDVDGFDFSDLENNDLIAKFVVPNSSDPSISITEVTKKWFETIKECELIPRSISNLWSEKLPVTGYTSWYNKFTEISENWLLDHIESIKEKTSWKIFQVDDGYQKCVGDWLIPDPAFPNKVDLVLKEASSKSLMPGIWIAPFVAMEFSDLVKENPGLVLKYKDGSPVVCGDFPHWGGKFYALDTEHPKFKSYIEAVVSHFASCGVKFIKADFLYGSSMIPRNGKTKAEISSRAHQWFYELCRKYDIYFLSCGAQMSSAYGRCDFSRIGADVAVEWEAAELETHKSRERPSAISSMNNTVGRSFLNGVVFHNDPDVVILRKENTELNQNEKKVLTRLNRDLGGLVFSSDSPHLFEENEMDLLQIMEEDQRPLTVESIHRVEEEGAFSYLVKASEKALALTVSPREQVKIKEFTK
jgi:alpha-galactosidase